MAAPVPEAMWTYRGRRLVVVEPPPFLSREGHAEHQVRDFPTKHWIHLFELEYIRLSMMAEVFEELLEF
jgi:hypothetical protein